MKQDGSWAVQQSFTYSGFSGRTAPLVNYGSGLSGAGTAHHVLSRVAQNRTTFLNSLATNQNAVPFLIVESAVEKLALF